MRSVKQSDPPEETGVRTLRLNRACSTCGSLIRAVRISENVPGTHR